MDSSESNQDQLSLISISIYLPLLILFILLAISANNTLKQQYNNHQIYKENNLQKLYILREQQIHDAKDLLKAFFTPYSAFQEIIIPLKTNNFLVLKTNYHNIDSFKTLVLNDAENLFFTELLQKLSQLGNIQVEIIFPSQTSFATITSLKDCINKILVKHNLPDNIYLLGLSEEEGDEIYFNFKLSN